MTFTIGDKVLINGAQLAEITYYDTASNWMCWDALGAPGTVSKCSNHISHTRVEYQGGYKPASTDGVERDIFGVPISGLGTGTTEADPGVDSEAETAAPSDGVVAQPVLPIEGDPNE